MPLQLRQFVALLLSVWLLTPLAGATQPLAQIAGTETVEGTEETSTTSHNPYSARPQRSDTPIRQQVSPRSTIANYCHTSVCDRSSFFTSTGRSLSILFCFWRK